MQIIALSGSSGFIGQAIKRLWKDRYTFVEITQELLYSPDNLAKFFKKTKPDIILHLAAYGNHANQDNPAMTVFSNIIGTFNMLYASLHTPYSVFVQFGSSSEYGKKVIPMKETDICDPETFYATSKLGATHLARTFARQYNKNVIVVRPFSVYGEGEAAFRFIPRVMECLKSGEMMDLDTQAAHDWIYIDDFVSGLAYAMQHAKPGEIVNIGTGRETTNLQVVRVLENITGKKLSYTEKQLRPNDSTTWRGDIAKLLGWGWRAQYPMGLALGRIVQWYTANSS